MSNKKFKTTIKCPACVAKVTPALDETLGSGNWSVDLLDPDRVLSTPDDIEAVEIVTALKRVGFAAELLDH